MSRTRLAAAALVTFGLLAPVAAATSASAAPATCGQAAMAKDFKHIKHAKAQAAKSKGKKVGHSKLTFVHAGKVTAVDTTASTVSFVVRGGQVKALRGCTIVVNVPATAKIMRNDAVATLADIAVGDHVNVKGTLAKDATTGDITYTATRVAASAPASTS
jgi:sRNA-binding protein